MGVNQELVEVTHWGRRATIGVKTRSYPGGVEVGSLEGDYYLKLANGDQQFRRKGIKVNQLVDSDTVDEIIHSINRWPESELNNYKYLYTSKPVASLGDPKLTLDYDFKDLGFRVDVYEYTTPERSHDDVQRMDMTYTILP